MRFDLDPTLTRVVLIGVLLFLEAFIGGGIVILTEGNMPTPTQWLTIIFVAALTIVTYFLSFLRGEETE